MKELQDPRTAAAATLALLLLTGCASTIPATPMVHASVAEPAAAPAREAVADLGAVRLFYTDTGGTGTPIVLLHPATGSARSWPYQQPVFAAAGYRVITYSRRGHAGSDLGSSTDKGTAAGDLALLLDHLQVPRIHAVGVAAGGIYATDFALRAPQRVQSLTLASSIVAVDDKAYMQDSGALRPRGFEGMPPEFRELSAQYRAANPDGTARWLALERANNMTPDALLQARQPLINTLTLDALSTLKVPVLFLTGDADLYTPPALLARMVAKVPAAQAAVLDGSGHAPHWERPDAFNTQVLAFIRNAPAR